MQLTYPTWKWLAIGGGLALLIMMVFYPSGYDQMAFMIGGEMTVKHGAVPYRDFIDTKPPVIFFIYGISSVIFGHHEWSIRIFDILFHILSLFYFYKILKRTIGDEQFAIIAIFLYSLFYVTSGYWMTAQAETFALLPALVAIDMTERVRSRMSEVRSREFLYGVYTGLACAILFLLKFTLLTVPLGIFIYLLFESRCSEFPKKYMWGLVVGLLSLIGLYAIYLSVTGTMQRFFEALDWVSNYAGIIPLLAPETISREYHILFPRGLLMSFSLSGLLVCGFGILKYLQNQSSSQPSTGDNRQSAAPIYLHFFIQFLLGLAGCLYERKFFSYQFSRAYWAFVPFVALGLRELWERWKRYAHGWKEIRPSAKLLRYSASIVLGVVLFFFSSAMRLASQPLHWMYMTITGSDIAQNVQDLVPQYYYKEEMQTADHLRPLLTPDDNIFIWGNSIGVYYYLNKYPTTICLTNTPLVTSWTPQTWKTTLLAQLKASPPHFFLAEFGDARSYLTAEDVDSWQHLQKWKDLKDFVESNYTLREEFKHFRIFEKK